MRILLNLLNFFPSIGGVENIGASLAAQFVKEGHQVTVWTSTENPADDDRDRFTFRVVRNPGRRTRLQLFHWCDVYMQAHFRWGPAKPLVALRRPWVVWNPDWYCAYGDWKRAVFQALAPTPRFVTNSRALAAFMPWRSRVIVNPYQDDVFFADERVRRTRDFLFVGRLVPDKGADIFLRALVLLQERSRNFTATVTGVGEQADALKQMAQEAGLEEAVRFTGPLTGSALADVYRSHRVTVVPSRWNEPFGIVALEAIACGCVVVGSSGGGLPEAIGPCGLTFPNGDEKALSQQLQVLLEHPEERESYLRDAPAHLDRHRPAHVAAQYLEELHALLGARGMSGTMARR